MNINLATKHHVFVAKLHSDAVSASKNAIFVAKSTAAPVSASKNAIFVAKLPAVPLVPEAPPAPAIKPVYGF